VVPVPLTLEGLDACDLMQTNVYLMLRCLRGWKPRKKIFNCPGISGVSALLSIQGSLASLTSRLIVVKPSWLCAVGSVPHMHDCPSLVGPAVINRTQIEFYCDVKTNETDSAARFNVSFLFDYEQNDDVPVQVVTADNTRATLHERYLANRLNKRVSGMTGATFLSLFK